MEMFVRLLPKIFHVVNSTYVDASFSNFNTQGDELLSDKKTFETTMFSNNTGFKLEADSVTINDYYSAISF